MRDSLRGSDFVSNRKLKKPLKIAKKNLNSVFEDVQISNESPDFSPITEARDDINEFGVSILPNPALSPSSETSIISDIADLSVLTTENNELDNPSVSCNGLDTLEGIRTGSVELEITVNLLSQARSQVLTSVTMNDQSKTLVDLLIKTVIDNLVGDYKETDQIPKLVFAKISVALLFLFCGILVLVLYFSNLGVERSFNGPLPT